MWLIIAALSLVNEQLTLAVDDRAVGFAIVVLPAHPIGLAAFYFPLEHRAALAADDPFAQWIDRAFVHGWQDPAPVQLLRPLIMPDFRIQLFTMVQIPSVSRKWPIVYDN